MLATAPIVRAVADALRRGATGPVVLDTVMVSKGGARLLDEAAVEALLRELVPRAAVITPNRAEAEVLTGRVIRTLDDLHGAAAALVALGARAVVAKGGHLEGPAIDVFHDGTRAIELRADRLDTRHTHGTGCTFSAAVAARLAHGDALEAAVRAAKDYVTRAIAQAPGLGHGHGPLMHFPS
jgi:hydroxymethylpyrimidine/phosphomethylpyrimidine kinase